MVAKCLVFIFIILGTSCLSGVHGQITCYSCNSYTNGAYGKACLDPMSPSVPTVNCSRGYVCTEVSYVTQKTLVTSRSCDPPTDTCNSIKRTLQGMYTDLASYKCRTCRSNYCNSNTGGVDGQITCYNCNSYTDGANGKACLDPMSPSVPTVNCARGYVCTKVNYVTQKTFVTSRSCDAPTNTCNSIKRTLQGMYPDLSTYKCQTCKSNYCNSNTGVILKISLAVVIFSAILSKIL